MTTSKNSQQLNKAERSGFTMIEFSLVIAFIAALLIAVAVITASIMQLYQKGLTLKAVNSVGRGLVEEFTGSINEAPAVDTTSLCNSYMSNDTAKEDCKNDHAYKFVYQQFLGQRATPGELGANEGADNTATVQLGGVFCTGKYSYIWNTYYGQDSGQTLSLLYNDAHGTHQDLGTNDNNQFRLARFPDETYRLCSKLINPGDYNDNYADLSRYPDNRRINIQQLANGTTNRLSEEPQQGFLNSFDLDLQLYEFVIFPISQDWVTQRTFMSGTFILATERGNINIERSGNYCDIHDLDDGEDASNIADLGAEFNYCAINRFNFAARTAGL